MSTWHVVYEWSELGFEVLVKNGIRVAGRQKFDNLLGESPEAVRELAREKTVELALERRVPLDCVRESSEPYVG